MGRGYGAGTAGFGLVSIGVLVTLFLLGVAAFGVARHPELHRAATGIGDGALVRRIRKLDLHRFGHVMPPLRDRLGLKGIAGVTLMVGLVVVTVMAIGFTDLLDDVLDGDGLAVVDQPTARWLAQHRDLWLTRVVMALTQWAGPAGQAVALAVVGAAAAYRGRTWLPVLVGLAGGGGITVVTLVAKAVVGRSRPASPFAMFPVPGFSFPSGHAAGASAVGLLCAWMLGRWVVHSWPKQVAVWSISAMVIGLVGFSRVYLGVHYVTDVLAGWLLGSAWAGVVILSSTWWSLLSQRRC